MRRILSLAILCLAAMLPAAYSMSAGCGKSPISSGTKSMTVNGKNRQYVLQVPANYNANTAYKLIFGFHWRGGNMNNVAPGYYGLRDLAKETAIFVAPDGLGNGWGNSGGEDVTFTDMMVKLIEDSLCVDETQIFATGWSYGGAMSYSLACSRPNVFRAVAVIAGAELSGCAGGTTPVAYLGIHGVHDSVLPISLGRGLRDKFLQLNGCASKNAPEPSQGSGTHIKTVYSCRAGYPVWWIAHDGDHVPDPADRGGQNWAPGETWTFFTQAVVGGGTGGNTGGGGSQPTTTSGSTPTTTPGTGGGGGTGNPNPSCSPKWGQCGGQGWTGATCCESGSSCKYSNPYYSQCL